MILEAIFNGEIYPAETVVPKSEKFREAGQAIADIMRYFEQTLSKEDYAKLDGHKDLKRSFPYPYLEYTEESFAVFFIIFTADLSHMKRRSLCRTIFDPSCTFLPVPDAAPASCVERSSSPVCKNVPSATGTGSSRWKRTKYPSQGHPSILRSLPETHSN